MDTGARSLSVGPCGVWSSLPSPTYLMPRAPPVVTATNVPRHGLVSPGGTSLQGLILWYRARIVPIVVQLLNRVRLDSLQPRGLQHARLLCPPLSSRVCSDSCPLSRWCHPTISSSASPFSFCFQSFPASGAFPVSWLLEGQEGDDYTFHLTNEAYIRHGKYQGSAHWGLHSDAPLRTGVTTHPRGLG